MNLRGVPVARGIWRQTIGLIGKRDRDELFLLIPRCTSVHTWFMRSAIDVVFLDAEHVVLDVRREVQPWSVEEGPRGTDAVLELPPGFALELRRGDVVTFD